MIQKRYIVIDIAKDSLEVLCESFKGRLEYNSQGLNTLIEKTNPQADSIVVCEATGGYERKLMDFLYQLSIPVALVNPARVRAFAKSEGVKAKTDPIDAQMLLRFAQSKDIKPSRVPHENQRALQALMDRRGQLTEMLAREKTRLPKSSILAQASIERVIDFIREELTEIEAQLKERIQSDSALEEQNRVMQSVTGVGHTTAWTILAYLGEITQVSRNQLVALAGIAPYNRDSGKLNGRRRTSHISHD